MSIRNGEAPSPIPAAAPRAGSTARPDEVARFGQLAERWWDRDGPMRVLLRMNPVRLAWLDAHVRRRLGDPGRGAGTPLRLLDVGCGAGIAAEALAGMGYAVLGIDASAEAIAAAREHAAAGGIADGLRYEVGAAEELDAAETGFDVVTAFEVVEHASAPDAFLSALAARVRPGGLVALTTVNRTARSLVVAKLGAEYVAGLLPRGTHRWRRFPTPGELSAAAAAAGLRVADLRGMVPDPRQGAGAWRLAGAGTGGTAVNYAMLLQA